MDQRKTHFEEVPISIAKEIAEAELTPGANRSKKRPWEEIAEELANEQDPARTILLAQELNDALEAKGSGGLAASAEVVRTAQNRNR